MYIKKIEFTNFRGFEKLSVDLPKNLAVFIGWNGSGKTTILDCLYLCILGSIIESLNHIEKQNLDNSLIKLITDVDNRFNKSDILEIKIT